MKIHCHSEFLACNVSLVEDKNISFEHDTEAENVHFILTSWPKRAKLELACIILVVYIVYVDKCIVISWMYISCI